MRSVVGQRIFQRGTGCLLHVDQNTVCVIMRESTARDISPRRRQDARGCGAGIPGMWHQTSEIPGAAWRDQKEFSNFALIIIRAGGVCPDCDLFSLRGMRFSAR
jgi:hypothetical protein